MEIAKVVLEFVKALAWPITVAALVWMFRAPIRLMLHRLRKAELPGGVSIDFQEEIQALRGFLSRLRRSLFLLTDPKLRHFL